jgi:HEAT repeat protein
VAALQIAPDAACVPGLTAVAQNRKLSVAVRAAALEGLGQSGESAAKKVIAEAEREGTTAVRAAAILASAQPGGGRAVLFRLTPMLRDPGVEVRVAAIAGLLRSVGDAALDQLYLLFKESDPRPYEAGGRRLARLSSEASAELLGRMLRKDDKRIRQAAAAALAARSDTRARALLEKVKEDGEAEIRVFASAQMDPSQRQQTVSALPAEGQRLYRALLQGTARLAAGDWLLGVLAKADPLSQTEMLGLWLSAAANPSGAVAAARAP